MMHRIALLGLSGVGKSTLINQLAERTPLIHLQASALIKSEQLHRSNRSDDSEALRLGSVLDNQSLMIAAYHRVVAVANAPIIFDGHSVIEGKGGLIEIPAHVFAKLQLEEIFFLSADPSTIVERRRLDGSRKRPVRDAASLAQHQQLACDVARRIATEVGCAFNAIEEGDFKKIEVALG